MCPLSFKERKVGNFCCLGQVLLCPEKTQGVEAQLSWWKPQPKTCAILPLGPIWGYPINTYVVWPLSTKPIITLNVTEWLSSSRLSIHIPGLSGFCISLAIWHPCKDVIPPWHYTGCSFSASNLLYLIEGLLLGFVPKLRNQVPDCLWCQNVISWDVANSEGYLRLLQVNPNVFSCILTPQGLIHDHPSISFLLLSKS